MFRDRMFSVYISRWTRRGTRRKDCSVNTMNDYCCSNWTIVLSINRAVEVEEEKSHGWERKRRKRIITFYHRYAVTLHRNRIERCLIELDICIICEKRNYCILMRNEGSLLDRRTKKYEKRKSSRSMFGLFRYN